MIDIPMGVGEGKIVPVENTVVRVVTCVDDGTFVVAGVDDATSVVI